MTWKKFFLYAGSLISLSLLVYLFFFSPFFKMHSVVVLNTKNAPADKISSTVKQTYSGKSMFFLSEQKIAMEIQKDYPKIVGINVEKHWPDGLVIKINEESITLLWVVASRFYGVNEKGEIFAAGPEPPPPTPPANLPPPAATAVPPPTASPTATPLTQVATPTPTKTLTPMPTPIPYSVISNEEIVAAQKNVVTVVDESNLPVSMGKEVVSQEFLTFLTEAKSELTKRTAITVVEFHIKETSFETYAVTDRFGIFFDTTRPAAEQVDALKRVLDAGIGFGEYADLRIPNKVYYK